MAAAPDSIEVTVLSLSGGEIAKLIATPQTSIQAPGTITVQGGLNR